MPPSIALIPPAELRDARALDPAFYASPETFARETAALRRGWHLVAHAAELARPGDWLTTAILGLPLVLVRDAAGALRGFHNICRHRAGPVAVGRGHGLTRLRCRYHGWSYALDGRLRAAPEMDAARDFDPAEQALPPVAVAEWEGLVFASPDPDAPFAALVDGVVDRIAPTLLGALTFHARRVYDVACDWKLYVDNYLEGYHVPHVHPALNGLLDYRHYDVEWDGPRVLQHAPLTGDGAAYGQGRTHYWWLWPTTMLNVVPGRLQSNRVEPLGPRLTRVTFDFFYDAASRRRAEEDLAVTDVVQAEDAAICEAVQAAFDSGAYRPGRLSPKREGGLWHFQSLVRAVHGV